MEKGKERKKRRRPGAFTSEEGQVGRRHEAQRKHIHVDARSGWTSVKPRKGSQNARSVSSDREDKKRHAGAEKG